MHSYILVVLSLHHTKPTGFKVLRDALYTRPAEWRSACCLLKVNHLTLEASHKGCFLKRRVDSQETGNKVVMEFEFSFGCDTDNKQFKNMCTVLFFLSLLLISNSISISGDSVHVISCLMIFRCTFRCAQQTINITSALLCTASTEQFLYRVIWPKDVTKVWVVFWLHSSHSMNYSVTLVAMRVVGKPGFITLRRVSRKM